MVMIEIEIAEGCWSRAELAGKPREKRRVSWDSVAGIVGEIVVLDGKSYTISELEFRA